MTLLRCNSISKQLPLVGGPVRHFQLSQRSENPTLILIRITHVPERADFGRLSHLLSFVSLFICTLHCTVHTHDFTSSHADKLSPQLSVTCQLWLCILRPTISNFWLSSACLWAGRWHHRNNDDDSADEFVIICISISSVSKFGSLIDCSSSARWSWHTSNIIFECKPSSYVGGDAFYIEVDIIIWWLVSVWASKTCIITMYIYLLLLSDSDQRKPAGN